VQVELRPGRLNRLAVLFRIILAIPAGIIAAVIAAGWEAVSFFCWLVVLILGRMPAPLFEATAAVLRYSMRLQAYFLLLTAAYPKRLFGDRPQANSYDGATGVASGRWSATHPLLLTAGGKVLLAVFIIAGLVGVAVPSGESGSGTNGTSQRTSAAAGHR
jgi:Domain of unknown function (DUF4389)